MRFDTASNLTRESVQQQAMHIRTANTSKGFHTIHIEPEDNFESILVVLRFQSEPVIVLLPEQSQAFNDPEHFAQLRQICSPEQVIFVIPPGRFAALARYAHEQGFAFASTLDAAAQLLMKYAEAPEKNDQIQPSSFKLAPYSLSEAGERSIGDEDGDGDRQPFDERQTAPPQWEPDSGFPLPEHTSAAPVYTSLAPRRISLMAMLAVLLVIASAVLFPALFSTHLGLTKTKLAVPLAAPVGQVAFSSSEQLDPLSTKGLNDIVTVDLHNLSTPAARQSYYAWLLPDQADDHTKPLLLGRLMIADGKAQLTYKNPDHKDLLAVYSRFAVTEEPGNQMPVKTLPGPQAVRYAGSIPDIPTPGDEQHYSLLSHMRHLLAADPTLQDIGLQGGLDIWLDRNAEKILEWSSAARDARGPGAADSIHRQVIRVLDYLDGSAYVYTSGDLPAGTPLLVDPIAGRIGLLELSQTQVLPGFLTHVDIHLQGLINAPGHTQAQKELAIKIDTALKEDTSLFQRVHQDAIRLVRMNDAELESNEALSLLDDMVTNANTAYTGQFDPATGGNINGIAWIHNELQGLATMLVTAPTQKSQ